MKEGMVQDKGRPKYIRSKKIVDLIRMLNRSLNISVRISSVI